MKNLAKAPILSFFFLCAIYFLWSIICPAPQYNRTAPSTELACSTEVELSLADTMTVGPHQALQQVSVIARVLQKRSPSNFLVFGLGHDNLMWSALNHGGRTVFLEEDETWIQDNKGKFPSLEVYHVKYEFLVNQADELLALSKSGECPIMENAKYSKCPLVLKGLPSHFHEVEWDLIMVNVPRGFRKDRLGRMKAIYTAVLIARVIKEGETDLFVHGVDRYTEDSFLRAFLCDGYLTEREGTLRHFTIPSHRDSSDIPFCP